MSSEKTRQTHKVTCSVIMLTWNVQNRQLTETKSRWVAAEARAAENGKPCWWWLRWRNVVELGTGCFHFAVKHLKDMDYALCKGGGTFVVWESFPNHKGKNLKNNLEALSDITMYSPVSQKSHSSLYTSENQIHMGVSMGIDTVLFLAMGGKKPLRVLINTMWGMNICQECAATSHAQMN